MVDIVLRDVAGGDVVLYPVQLPPSAAPTAIFLYPLPIAAAPPALVITLTDVGGSDVVLRWTQPAPTVARDVTIVLRSTAAPESDAGPSPSVELAGAGVARAEGAGVLEVGSGAVDCTIESAQGGQSVSATDAPLAAFGGRARRVQRWPALRCAIDTAQGGQSVNARGRVMGKPQRQRRDEEIMALAA